MSKELAKLLRDPVTWIKTNPKGSGPPEIPIPRELHRCLTKLSPERKDGLITGMILAAGALKRNLNKVQKGGNKNRRGRTPAASLAVKNKANETPLPQASTRHEEDLTTCMICLVSQIQQATQCGHVFCRDCLSRWKEQTGKCPTCRHPVNMVVDLYLGI